VSHAEITYALEGASMEILANTITLLVVSRQMTPMSLLFPSDPTSRCANTSLRTELVSLAKRASLTILLI